MDILLYLSELLQQRTSVGITGLGTFFKKKFAGKYDKEKQSFLPPGYNLLFTAEVKDGELLRSFVAQKRNISAESAAYYISQFVDDVNKKLEIEHEAELENLGRLFFTEHEGLSFEPSNKINYGSEFYGLPEVAETELSNEKESDVYRKDIIPEKETKKTYNEDGGKAVDDKNKNVPEWVLPIVENIELDEVKDDLKNTLSNSEPNILDIEHEEVDVPDAVREQHAQHPNRFGHQPESELPKTYINLSDDAKDEQKENIVKAPEFIQEQHAEHPNRFGHDPLSDVADEEQNEKSIWSKIGIAIFALIIIVAIIYFVKPDWFGGKPKMEHNTSPVAIVDSTKNNTVDSTKFKQDSIAKTDSILKANQVQSKNDSSKSKVVAPTPKMIATTPKIGVTSYEVIAASFKTTKKAEQFIQQMKGYGITAKIVPIEGPYKKVSVASYKTEKEALDARPILSKKIRIKELDIKQINTP